MLFLNVLVSIFFAYTCQASRYRLAEVADQFRRHNIPEDLHINFKPQVLLEVTFPQANGSSVSITPGEELGKNGNLVVPLTVCILD
ncbi:hypothetical protein CPC08DRAFT_771703 [Agrocybe pediades]|nr:hypothetical protein CPC08DRAFT_771703 [Agrocybe pediades]